MYPKNKIHFVGIGGIGMSALAQLFLHEGKKVTGSDRGESPTTDMLTKKGVDVKFEQVGENVPKDADLLVYSDAVPEDNLERVRAKELGIKQMSYFEALGEVTHGRLTVAVSGTNGKTTTTAMITKILRTASRFPTAIIGSIVKDFGSNFFPGSQSLFVVEACEYRDHLLKLSPTILVITNIEWDHTDYFPSLKALQETFRRAVEEVPERGVIVTDPNHPNIAPVLKNAHARIVDYTKEEVPELMLIGEFNRMNARAAKAAVLALSSSIEQSLIDEALQDFKGTWRRFEEKGTMKNGALVYDDYAHHPTAIRETLQGVRERFPEKKVTVVFHPHLYSRTKDLFEGFVLELSKADYIILAPIYAAREKDTGEVSSDKLAEEIMKRNKNVLSLKTFDEIETELTNNKSENDLVITMGAGDIYIVADHLVG